jgi:hypothetical protein
MPPPEVVARSPGEGLPESMGKDRAARHDHAADVHEAAAARHDQSVGFWERAGDAARAALAKRRAAFQREGAQIERDHARLERDDQ